MRRDLENSSNRYDVLQGSPEEEQKAREEYRKRREQLRKSGFTTSSAQSDKIAKAVQDEFRAMKSDQEQNLEHVRKPVKQEVLLDGKAAEVKKPAVKQSVTEKQKVVPEKTSSRSGQSLAADKNVTTVSEWFLTMCWVKIPIIGFIYMLITIFRKKTEPTRRNFAKAYILYRIMILFLAICLIVGLFHVGVNFVDGMLSLLD